MTITTVRIPEEWEKAACTEEWLRTTDDRLYRKKGGIFTRSGLGSGQLRITFTSKMLE